MKKIVRNPFRIFMALISGLIGISSAIVLGISIYGFFGEFSVVNHVPESDFEFYLCQTVTCIVALLGLFGFYNLGKRILK